MRNKIKPNNKIKLNFEAIKAVLGALVTTLFGVYVLYLFYTGKINFYIHPRYTEFALITSWIAIGFGVVFTIRLIESRGKSLLEAHDHHGHSHKHDHEHSHDKHDHSHDHAHDHKGHSHNHEKDHDHKHEHHKDEKAKGVWSSLGNFWQKFQTVAAVILIVLPLILGFLLPVRPLSAVTAQQRVVDLNGFRSTESTASLFLKNTRNYTLGDWIKVINNNPDINRFVDKEVRVSGFIFSPDANTQQFLVSRFLITCCAVDARPLGLWVEANWQESFRENQWVEVNGRFISKEVNGQPTLVVVPELINQISEPSDPYVF